MKEEYKITERKVNCVSASLEQFDHLANPEDFIEIREWSNGEGFDLYINMRKKVTNIELTWGEWEAMKKMIKKMQKME